MEKVDGAGTIVVPNCQDSDCNNFCDHDFDIVILADGDYPTSSIPLRILKEAKILICCDNAGKRLIERTGIVPHAIVGDGDSLPEAFKDKYANIWHQVDEQDYNDLTKATRYAIEHYGCTKQVPDGSAKMPLRIAYLAVTGKREDHTIGNVSLINFYRRTFGIDPMIISDYGYFTAHEGNIKLKTFPRQQVSIFNLSASSMSSKGLKWQISAYEEWWMGTLNEALGNSITILSDGAFIVYRTHEAKK